MTWQHPLPPKLIGDKYGDKEPPRTQAHRGTDYRGDARQFVRAVSDGVIHNIFYSACLGWIVELETDEHGLYFGYSHLACQKHGVNCDGKDHEDGSNCNKNIQKGDRVKAGQPIGLCGNTGLCSRGVHLHLTVSKKPDPRYAKTFDAEKFINQKIKKQESLAKKAKKTEVTEKPQKPEEKPSKVVAPEKAPKPPRSVLEALKVVMAWFSK